MSSIDILQFERLKSQIQAQYLKLHTPSEENISKWKGIDIVYFQEDLRKLAKGIISEKSFYTYFKSNPVTKLPRIDVLNLLSVYAGYDSWADFKKKNPITDDFTYQDDLTSSVEISSKDSSRNSIDKENTSSETKLIPLGTDIESSVLQKNTTDNEVVSENNANDLETNFTTIAHTSFSARIKSNVWLILAILFGLCGLLLGFKDDIFGRTFVYCFNDADRNSPVQFDIEIKVLKNNESPLIYRVKPGQCFHYSNRDKTLEMEISSSFYENVKVTRNLQTAPTNETIELKPDDYKFAFYYFSRKDISGKSDEIINQKRKELQNRIADDAVIKQIYDSDIYGLETISKEKYITLVTTPTTSLKNLKLIETKRNAKGKIISIKFKIESNENQP